MLVKFMKGSPEFRESSKSYTQFANEIFVYAELLPAYENLLRSSKLNTDLVEQLVPRTYCAKFGLVEGERRQLVALLHSRLTLYIYMRQVWARPRSRCWRCSI